MTDLKIDRVRIFDTTLRDGEQAPGFSMTEAAKLRMAKALASAASGPSATQVRPRS